MTATRDSTTSRTRRPARLVPVAALGATLLLAGAAAAQSAPGDLERFRLGQARSDIDRAIPDVVNHERCATARVGPVDYRLRFTPGGRVYRIETRRELEPAALTESGRADLLREMTARYGPPDVVQSYSRDVHLIWRRPDAPQRIVKLRPSAAGGSSPVVLRMELLDAGLLQREREAAWPPWTGEGTPGDVRERACRNVFRGSATPPSETP